MKGRQAFYQQRVIYLSPVSLALYHTTDAQYIKQLNASFIALHILLTIKVFVFDFKNANLRINVNTTTKPITGCFLQVSIWTNNSALGDFSHDLNLWRLVQPNFVHLVWRHPKLITYSPVSHWVIIILCIKATSALVFTYTTRDLIFIYTLRSPKVSVPICGYIFWFPGSVKRQQWLCKSSVFLVNHGSKGNRHLHFKIT